MNNKLASKKVAIATAISLLFAWNANNAIADTASAIWWVIFWALAWSVFWPDKRVRKNNALIWWVAWGLIWATMNNWNPAPVQNYPIYQEEVPPHRTVIYERAPVEEIYVQQPTRRVYVYEERRHPDVIIHRREPRTIIYYSR